jgi:hypothetical protein
VRRPAGSRVLVGNLPAGQHLHRPFQLICGKRIVGLWGGAIPGADIPSTPALYLEGSFKLKRARFPPIQTRRRQPPPWTLSEGGGVNRALIEF